MPRPPILVGSRVTSPGQTLNRDILRLAVPALGALDRRAAVPHRGLRRWSATSGSTPLAGLGIASAVLQTIVGLMVFLAYSTTPAVARRFGGGRPDQRGVGRHRRNVARARARRDPRAGRLPRDARSSWDCSARRPTSPREADDLPRHLDVGPARRCSSSSPRPGSCAACRTPSRRCGSPGSASARTRCSTGCSSTASAGASPARRSARSSRSGAWWPRTSSSIGRLARRHSASVRPHREGVRGSARSGGWLFLRTVSLRVALLATVVVATGLGTEELAGWQVAFTIFSTAAFALDALAIAAQALIGKGLGAGDRAARASRAGSHCRVGRVVRGRSSGVVIGGAVGRHRAAVHRGCRDRRPRAARAHRPRRRAAGLRGGVRARRRADRRGRREVPRDRRAC